MVWFVRLQLPFCYIPSPPPPPPHDFPASAGEQSSLFTAARLLHPYYIVVGIYSLVLVAAGLPLATYFDAQHQPQLHVLLCVALWVVGTVCVLRCCQFSWRLLMTRGEWWNLWRRQAGTLGVRFVVLASSLPLALGLIALYCQWRHAQHMAENGPRWHGALFSCALAVPRVIYEIMISKLHESSNRRSWGEGLLIMHLPQCGLPPRC